MKNKFKLLILLSSILLLTSCTSLITQQNQIGYVTNSNITVDENTVGLKELLQIKGTL